VLLDLMTVKFLSKYVARPMQFFGLPGLLSFAGGLGILAYLFVERVGFGHGVADRPLLAGSLLMTILGVQFISLGLLGELLTRIYFENGNRRTYVIRSMIGFEEPERYVTGRKGTRQAVVSNGSGGNGRANGHHADDGQIMQGQLPLSSS
jgi:hypothetical protein